MASKKLSAKDKLKNETMRLLQNGGTKSPVRNASKAFKNKNDARRYRQAIRSAAGTGITYEDFAKLANLDPKTGAPKTSYSSKITSNGKKKRQNFGDTIQGLHESAEAIERYDNIKTKTKSLEIDLTSIVDFLENIFGVTAEEYDMKGLVNEIKSIEINNASIYDIVTSDSPTENVLPYVMQQIAKILDEYRIED